MRSMRELGEFGLIERLARILPSSPNVVEGIGDDCAVLKIGDRQLLATTDMFIEDVHFRRRDSTPSDIGWKAAAAGLSDIAAMGGAPLFSLVSLACPGESRSSFIEGIYNGMSSLLSRFGAVIVGGDTTRTEGPMVLDVVSIGEITGSRCLRRRGAKVGDQIVVTGKLGLAAGGLHALEHAQSAEELVLAHNHPLPRISEGQWLASRSEIHAMIDISDGLVQDVGHLATAGRLGVDLHPANLVVAPELARYCEVHGLDAVNLILTGGEDYELAFAIDGASAGRTLAEFHHEFRAETTVVGEVTDQWTGVRIDGEASYISGFDHFKSIR